MHPDKIVEKLPPLSELGFGKYYGPQMILSTWKDDVWSPWSLQPMERLTIHPGAKVLHYAQEVFEGLKAYKQKDGSVALFRPQANIARMSRSAVHMAMPPYPEAEYLACLKALVKATLDLVPEQPGSLYLRPTMIGSSTALGVHPASEYLFYVLASPVGGYFGDVVTDVPASVSIFVTDQHARAVRGGLGAAKTGANYAASLRAVADAKAQGFNNVLFLDAVERSYLEELSGMNVFAVIDGVLRTPPLGDTILAGVTRDSLLKIAAQLRIAAEETPISTKELFSGLSNGRTTEVFACGTASAVTSIRELGWHGEKIRVADGKPGPIATQLYRQLTGIHSGHIAAPESGWLVKI
jgi:branched-chain amino acid aminotransferase